MDVEHIYRARAARAVRIYCPVEQETFRALIGGNSAVLEMDPNASRMLAIIRSSDVLGDFGHYKGVVEISLGLESFTPSVDARPTLGEAGATSVSPTVILTTFVDDGVSEAALSSALQEVIRAHPWEVPVIEIMPTQLLLR